MTDATTDNPSPINYPEWLYDYAAAVQDGIAGLDAVTDDGVQAFHERGYLVVHDAFTPDETQAAMTGLLDLIAGKHPAFDGFHFEDVMQDKVADLTIAERQDAIRKLAWYVDYDERLKALAYHPKLMSVLQRIIGDDDITMFQDMALIKPPRIGREKPWHQDMAYFNVPLDTTVVGVWIALDEATPENGCMMVIPGSHKKGAVIHFKKRDWQICDTDVYNDGAVAVPLKPGSILLFHGLIHHGTPANLSDNRRRALQYHYRASSVQPTSEAERLANFGSEGTGVTC